MEEVEFEHEVKEYLILALKFSDNPPAAMAYCRLATECIAHTLYFQINGEYPSPNDKGEYPSLSSTFKEIKDSLDRQTKEVLFSINAQSRGSLHWNFQSRDKVVKKHHVEAVVTQISNSYIDIFNRKLHFESMHIDEDLSSLLAHEEISNYQLIPDAEEYLRLGKKALARGRYFSGEMYFRDALNIFKSDSNLKGEAQTKLKLCDILKIKGNIEEGIAMTGSALELYQELRDNEGIVDAYHTLSSFAIFQEDLDEAEFFSKKALEISSEINYQKGVSKSYFRHGSIYRDRGNLDLGLRYFQKSLDIQEERKKMNGVAMCLRRIAFIYRLKGDLDKSYDKLVESLNIVQRENSFWGLRNTFGALGNLEHRRGNLIEAEEYLLKALSISRTSDLRTSERGSLINLGNFYITTGELEKAEAVTKEAIELSRTAGSEVHFGICLHNLGLIAKKRKQFTESRLMFQESMEIHKNHPLRVSETLGELAKLEQELGNIKISEDLEKQSLMLKKNFGAESY